MLNQALKKTSPSLSVASQDRAQTPNHPKAKPKTKDVAKQPKELAKANTHSLEFSSDASIWFSSAETDPSPCRRDTKFCALEFPTMRVFGFPLRRRIQVPFDECMCFALVSFGYHCVDAWALHAVTPELCGLHMDGIDVCVMKTQDQKHEVYACSSCVQHYVQHAGLYIHLSMHVYSQPFGCKATVV